MSYQDLSIYFFEELYQINKTRNIKLSTDAIGYISELLLRGIKRDFLFNDKEKKYLFDLYIKSVQSKGRTERFENYRHLGDYSLFVSGYFTDSISDVVGVEYYIDMGSRAYEQAAICMYNIPYIELANKYEKCVSIINELSLTKKHDSHNDMIKLYEFWQLTNSQYTKEKLLKLGLITEAIDE